MYDANTIYNTLTGCTPSASLPPLNRTEFHHHPLGTAVQPYGGETYHMVANTTKARSAADVAEALVARHADSRLVSNDTHWALAIGELVKAVGQSLNHVIGEPGVHHCASRLIVPPTAIKFMASVDAAPPANVQECRVAGKDCCRVAHW